MTKLDWKEERVRAIFSMWGGLFGLIMPHRVFIAISSDLIQISVILIPTIAAVMAIVATTDLSFNIPPPSEAVEKVNARRNEINDKLSFGLFTNLSLLAFTLAAKILSLWLDGSDYLSVFINHFLYFIVGFFVVGALFTVRQIVKTFSHLSVGAQFGLAWRAFRSSLHSQREKRP